MIICGVKHIDTGTALRRPFLFLDVTFLRRPAYLIAV